MELLEGGALLDLVVETPNGFSEMGVLGASEFFTSGELSNSLLAGS
jgi:hypothetical protein